MKRTDLEALQLCKKHWETIIAILEKEGTGNRNEDDIKNKALRMMGKRPDRIDQQCFCCHQTATTQTADGQTFRDLDCYKCLLWPANVYGWTGCCRESVEFGRFCRAVRAGDTGRAIQAARDIVALTDKAIAKRTP